jgi:limonene-1,2-epoxide hydrolase
MTASEDDLARRLEEILVSFGREGEGALARLAPLYAPGVVFRDPLQTLKGREAFIAMNRRVMRRARRLSFEVHDRLGGGGSLFLTWSMTFEPRRGPALVFVGATHARVRDGAIVEQRDYWDLLSSVAASVPVVRRVYRALARRLG